MPVCSKFGLISAVFVVIAIISACDSGTKEKKSGQALVSVNSKEITVVQLNDELKRVNIRVDQYDSASKQLLESLIARQLFVDEAVRNKLDRTPEILQARERANAQIIAQSYIQGILSKIQKPSVDEIEAYYQKHPELFQQRKQFDLAVIRLATSDLNESVKKVIDAAKSLDEVGNWLDKQKISYNHSLSTRSSTDLPREMTNAFQEKEKGTIFIVNEHGNSLLMNVLAVTDAPVSVKQATPQIEKILLNNKHKETIEAEIARLRAAAKIEYKNGAGLGGAAAGKNDKSIESLGIDADKGAENFTESISNGNIERGIMGLK